jgi:hypothetical protein
LSKPDCNEQLKSLKKILLSQCTKFHHTIIAFYTSLLKCDSTKTINFHVDVFILLRYRISILNCLLASPIRIYRLSDSTSKPSIFQSRSQRDYFDEPVMVPFFGASMAIEPNAYLADVNGDGAKDWIVNEKGKVSPLENNIAVALSTPNSEDL